MTFCRPLRRGMLKLVEVESDCPYYRGVGQCETGCWAEPRCVTDEPVNGWGSELVLADMIDFLGEDNLPPWWGREFTFDRLKRLRRKVGK